MLEKSQALMPAVDLKAVARLGYLNISVSNSWNIF
jgi:hypothetical protein